MVRAGKRAQNPADVVKGMFKADSLSEYEGEFTLDAVIVQDYSAVLLVNGDGHLFTKSTVVMKQLEELIELYPDGDWPSKWGTDTVGTSSGNRARVIFPI